MLAGTQVAAEATSADHARRRRRARPRRPRGSLIDLDGPVFVERVGSAGPPMVLVHGLASSHVHWRGVSQALGRDYRVQVPDLPGFGRSPLAGRDANLRAGARILDALLDRLGEPAILVGNSAGALISMMVATERPAAVAALVLVAPPAPHPLRTPLEPGLAMLFSAYCWPGLGELAREAWVRLHGPEGSVQSMLQICCYSPHRVSEEIVEAALGLSWERSGSRDDVRAFLALYRSAWLLLLNSWRYDRLVRRITPPTLVLHGMHDRLVPAAVAQRLRRLRADWSFVNMPAAGHMPHLEDPDQFVGVLQGWLEEVDGRSQVLTDAGRVGREW
jgi:pimeloyl-ACP methyl ester carboxylesterase